MRATILRPWWRPPATSSKPGTHPAASLDNHAKAIVEITRNAVSEGLVPGADLVDVWADIFRLENRFEASVDHIISPWLPPGACGHLVQAAVGTRERPQPLPRVEVVRDRGQGAHQRIGIGVQHLVTARNLEHLVFAQIPGHGEPSRAATMHRRPQAARISGRSCG